MTEVNAGGISNLVSGFKGSGVSYEVQGLQQTAFQLARVTNVNFRKNLRAYHGRQIGILTGYARANFESEIERPDETGERGHARMTGRFGFGQTSGGAFIGVNIFDPNSDTYGFGYPNVERADKQTNYVWRSLEFGLSGARHTAISHPLAPRGRAKFPTRFTFLPFSGARGGVLHPRGSGSAAAGTLVTPQGRVVRKVEHPGIRPKQFITRAFEQMSRDAIEGYRTVVAQTYKDFS